MTQVQINVKFKKPILRCAACGDTRIFRVRFRPSFESGLKKLALQLTLLAPFSCSNCGNRFYRLRFLTAAPSRYHQEHSNPNDSQSRLRQALRQELSYIERLPSERPPEDI